MSTKALQNTAALELGWASSRGERMRKRYRKEIVSHAGTLSNMQRAKCKGFEQQFWQQTSGKRQHFKLSRPFDCACSQLNGLFVVGSSYPSWPVPIVLKGEKILRVSFGENEMNGAFQPVNMRYPGHFLLACQDHTTISLSDERANRGEFHSGLCGRQNVGS
eukprot:scaffold19715_cov19-Tisochrysis_lutea.AAC.1